MKKYSLDDLEIAFLNHGDNNSDCAENDPSRVAIKKDWKSFKNYLETSLLIEEKPEFEGGDGWNNPHDNPIEDIRKILPPIHTMTISLEDWEEQKKWAELGKLAEGIRPEVLWFAKQMENKLKQNDWKGGWKDCEFVYLAECLINQSGDLMMDLSTLIEDSDSSTINSIINKATNTANFAMMIADVCQKRKELDK